MENGQVFGRVLQTGQSIRCTGIAFSPNKEHIVTGSSEGGILFWNVELMQNWSKTREAQGKIEVREFALSDNGTRVLALTNDFKPNDINVFDGTQIERVTPPLSLSGNVALDHSGRQAAYTTRNTMIEVLYLDNGVRKVLDRNGELRKPMKGIYETPYAYLLTAMEPKWCLREPVAGF